MVLDEGSEFDITKNITVVTCSMNRTEQLLRNIDECKNIKNLYQHIVIDFSSDEPGYRTDPKTTFLMRSRIYKIP